MLRICVVLLALCLLVGCSGHKEEEPAKKTVVTPSTTELRGVWVAYYELDKLLSGCDAKEAEKAITAMVDHVAERGLNTIFFHLRGNGDAYYSSKVYPVADGVKDLIAKGFDPLACAVTAAHARGMELHAWINPYRLGKRKGVEDLPTFTHEGVTYYAPHDDGVQQLIIRGIREILDNYEVDGVQFDDYFYPLSALPTDKPGEMEKTAFAAYQKKHPAATVGDFRREGVSSLIRQVHTLAQKQRIPFGVSPAGDGERVKEGMYADVMGWMAAGEIDYVCPQLYFGFDHDTYPFHEILEQWLSYEREVGVKLYVGLALYKVGENDRYAGSGEEEFTAHDSVMARQINFLRTREGVEGFGLFSYIYLTPQNEIARREWAALTKVLG